MVEHRGFEPLTSTLRTLRATNCANAPYSLRAGDVAASTDNRYNSTTVCKLQALFLLFSSDVCRSTIHLGQSKKKRMRDRVSCAKVELPHNNLAKGDHISHEQEYNTGHGIPAISHEVCRKIWRQPRQSEIQQEPVVHLLLEAALGWKCGIPCLSVQAASQPSKPAYGSRTETHPGHAPQKSNPGHD